MNVDNFSGSHLLFLRLPWRQPFVEIFLADDFHHSVHFVMAEAAKLSTGNLVIPDFRRCKVHVDREPGDCVLLEAHRRDKEAVNHVHSAQSQIDLAINRQIHRAGDHIVFRGRIGSIQADGGLTTSRGIHQLGSSSAKLAVRARITKIPGELHAGNFDRNRTCLRGFEASPPRWGCPLDSVQ